MLNINSAEEVKALKTLFLTWSGIEPDMVIPIKGSGSNRQYYRLGRGNLTAIGVFNHVIPENLAYFSLTSHFKVHGLRVPDILIVDQDNQHYLLQDIGNDDLLSVIENTDPNDKIGQELIKSRYQKVIDDLILFQVEAGKNLDYSVCYPLAEFSFDNYLNDLLYFRYYFLNFSGIAYSEEKLMSDFKTLAQFLIQADSFYFAYRDFQARNILIDKNTNSLYYIDFQGGRKGPLQYDLASLLFQAKAKLSPELRYELIEYYLEKLSGYIFVNKEQFYSYFWCFVLVRILQTLGAYGLRGLIEKKLHFIKSIPLALKNVEWLAENIKLEVEVPELMRILGQIADPKENVIIKPMNLNVKLFSFSYKKNIPVDESGNGGGFLFDCRCLPNPGRLEEYRNLTGKDLPVAQYLENEPDVGKFIDHSYSLIKMAVENYISRGFGNLSIGFGCTGGQHRSVYCTEIISKKLMTDFLINLKIFHTNIE